MPMIQIWISLKLNRSRKYSQQEHELSFMYDILTRVRSNYLNADPQKFTQWVDDLMDLRDSVTPLWNWLSWHQLLHTHTTLGISLGILLHQLHCTNYPHL